MQKFFGLPAIFLLSAAAVTAQTAGHPKPCFAGQEPNYAKSPRSEEAIGRQGEAVISRRSRTRGKSKGAARSQAPRVLRVGPSTTYLSHGLSTDEVLRLLGQPASVSERREGNSLLATYIFPRSEGRVLVAEFENRRLVRSRIEISEYLVQGEETR